MNTTYEALQVLVILIPGFISAAIMDRLLVRKEKKEISLLIEALIFSMIIYAIYLPIFQRPPIAIDSQGFQLDRVSFMSLVVISIFLPLILSFLATTDLHMRAARYLQLTTRTARGSVWQDVFTDKEKSVIINFEDGRRVYGWPEYFSDEPEQIFLYLKKPSWIENGKFVDLNVDGILITPNEKIDSIEFLD